MTRTPTPPATSEVPASASQSIAGFIGYLQAARGVDAADMLEPVDTSAVVAADRRDRASRRRSTEATRRGGAARRRPPLASRRCECSLALTGALGGRSFLRAAPPARRRGADRADARRRGRSRCCRRRRPSRSEDAARCASGWRRIRDDPALASAVARRYLAQAHESAIRASPAWRWRRCGAWPDPSATPADVLLMRATLQQYLHEFDAAVAHLRLLLARPGGERQAQAWLTLATVLRVQGRYAESDAACRGLERRRREVYARRVPGRERGALRGEAAARAAQLRGAAGRPRACRRRRAAWLHDVAGRARAARRPRGAADAAYRAVLKLGPDTLRRDRLRRLPDRAAAGRREALARARRTSRAATPSLLRLAIAGALARRARVRRARDVAEMRERIALANERPERARLPRPRAGDVRAGRRARRRSARSSSRAATSRASASRSTCWCFAQAARASGRRDAIEEARRLKSRSACTIGASMPCSEARGGRCARLRAVAWRLARPGGRRGLLLAAGARLRPQGERRVPAARGRARQLDVRWDIALRDLDVALDLDSDADGKLTWGEVRAAWPRIEGYALPRLAIDGCALAPVGRGARAAQRRRLRGAVAGVRLHAAGRAGDRLRAVRRRRPDAPRHRQASSAPGRALAAARCSSRRRTRPRRAPPRATRSGRRGAADARRRPCRPRSAGVALAVPARRRAPHPHRLRPRAVPALPAPAGGDAPHAVRLAAGGAAGAGGVAGGRHRHGVHGRALDHARRWRR